MNSFEAVVKKALEGWPKGTLFLAAVSGGADSTAMLAALIALREETGFEFRVLHVEHGIRPPEESRLDAQAVVERCKDLEVPCRVVSIPPGRIKRAGSELGLGMGAAARFYRHRAWNREAKRVGAARVLVAHTRDDLLETCLIRVLRGSGPAGLALMPRERGRILRPILDLSRADVLSYLEGRGIPFQIDSSNADTHYLRNRIRHVLVPLLDDSFPSWRASLSGLAETQSLAAAFIKAEAQKRLAWNHGHGGLFLDGKTFLVEPSIVQEEAVFLASDILGAGLSVPRRRSLRSFLKGLVEGELKASDLGPIRLEMRDNRIIVRKKGSGDFERGFSLLIDAPGFYTIKAMEFKTPLKIKAELVGAPGSGEGSLDFVGNNCFFSSLPVVFRPWRGKDFIHKAGQKPCLSDIIKGEDRPGYSSFITAEDRSGVAAFIGLGVQKEALLLARDDNPAGLEFSRSLCKFYVENRIFGGIDA